MKSLSLAASSVRIDKWLWAARFFKTRSLATNAVELGRVLQNEQRVKPAHAVKIGDQLEIQHGEQTSIVIVLGLSEIRGPAPVAQALYQETGESIAKRQQRAENRRMQVEPSIHIQSRPTKKQRRQLNHINFD
ncbi:RNA-binding S4 domain-containing protein [Undibacterium sp. LX40W]|uniref:RNA-binding S4 domain-containing protein n=1 Tax=Undibacterium nitidum TaxID=2762298 RepID=A0A923HLA5_9BURK|nr:MULTISPECIES: RNA-binding S4 domain-containing protein [Undibacterium]MBC3881464.1 RNA-binding S4 domain-containing protein [Undibacterium nitidum]MBC3891754.1 RNA-binding S4 domain-containing protein [Undibacterium sp. LX40W]